jgi:chromatin structure-remodeling complex subunit RSC3/30
MLRDIARRNKEAWESFPEAVRYYPEIWNGNRSREECFFSVLTYLDLIYNDFLLQRTLVRRIRARCDELLRISRLLMTTLLDVIGNRAGLRSSSCDIPWLVSILNIGSLDVANFVG